MTKTELEHFLNQIFDEYLLDAKADVRKMAVEILAGFSSNEDDSQVMETLARDPNRYVSRLFSKTCDLPMIAALAWDALINYAVDQRIALHLYDKHYDRLLACIQSRELVFSEAATKLLANISKHIECRSETVANLLGLLLPLFLAGRRHNPHCNYDFLAGTMADLTNTREGRLFFLENLTSNLEPLLPELHSPSVIRRGGIAALIKNCLFETDWHNIILTREEADDFLITSLAGCLLDCRSVLNEEERDCLPIELQIVDKLRAEPDMIVRAMLVESLIILATTRQGRDLIRNKGIYPILREWHKLEPIKELKGLVEKMVELIIRDESTLP